MENFMKGYGAAHGVFLIMDDTGKNHVARAKAVFGRIPNVSAMVLDCFTPAQKNPKKKTSSRKTAKKKSTTKAKKVSVKKKRS